MVMYIYIYIYVNPVAQVVKVLEVLVTYNVSVKGLKKILSYLYATQSWVRGDPIHLSAYTYMI